jgi:hypothetical protein
MCADIIERIMRIGWTMMFIMKTEDQPSYVYTVGLGVNPRHQGHDFVISGMPAPLAVATMEALYTNYIVPGIRINDGQKLLHVANVPVIAKVLPNNLQCFGMGIRVSNLLREMVGLSPVDEYPMIQLCWPDKNDKYCWEKEYIKGKANRTQTIINH